MVARPLSLSKRGDFAGLRPPLSITMILDRIDPKS
jgi:hypothetical protein